MDVEQYLKNFYAGTKDPSLAAMKYFMAELGHPEKKLKCIHIAGTNGKGAICEMMSNILVKSGYRMGKFMSPHLICYNERIAINNEPITDEEMEQLILELMPKVENYNQNHTTPITLFELETAMALLYFSRKHCDFVVLETGLGGLHDCTNIINSSISIISSIGYDHMNLLGNTLPEIATQKAGIIKENGDTIFVKQEENVNKIIQKTCQEKSNILHIIDPKDITQIRFEHDFTQFDYQNYKEIRIPLKGVKQPQNAAICLECFNLLKSKNVEIPERAIKEGLENVVHKGRFERISENPEIIFDGAHNEPAIQHLKENVDLYYKNSLKVFIFSVLATKDYTKILEQILQEDAIFIFTDGNEEGKFVSKEELYDKASKIVNPEKLYKRKMAEAIRLVKEKYSDCVTFIIGSFYVYETVMKELEEEKNDTN